MTTVLLLIVIAAAVAAAAVYTAARKAKASPGAGMSEVVEAKVIGKGSFMDLAAGKCLQYIDLQFEGPDGAPATAQFRFSPGRECILEEGDCVAARYRRDGSGYKITIVDFYDYTVRRRASKKGPGKRFE